MSPPTPPPPPPTPGPRAAQFLSLYSKALGKTSSTISYASFAACFPTIAHNAPDVLQSIHGQISAFFAGAAQKEFDALMRDRDVVANLNELEALLAEARRRRARGVEGEKGVVAPHLLPPEDVTAAHLAPLLASQQSMLNARLQTVQSRNASKFALLRAQRKEIEGLLEGLEGDMGDLEGVNKGWEGVEGLRSVVGEVEVEMAGL